MNRHFKGVWIPKEIYLDETLSWTEKILLIEIHSLQGEEGCYASNQYLAEFLGTSEKTVVNTISRLKGMDYLQVEQLRNPRLLKVNPELWTSTSQNRDVTSQNREVTSQNRDVTSQKKDSTIYRINNTENNTEIKGEPTNGLTIFRKYYPHLTLHLFNQELLTNLTTDLDVFEQAVLVWVKRQYREQNIGGMLDLHQKMVNEAKKAVPVAHDLFCEKCKADSGWLRDGEEWVRCKH